MRRLLIIFLPDICFTRLTSRSTTEGSTGGRSRFEPTAGPASSGAALVASPMFASSAAASPPAPSGGG
eukprot:8746029-Heterocapsa_arctica.AAC.1